VEREPTPVDAANGIDSAEDGILDVGQSPRRETRLSSLSPAVETFLERDDGGVRRVDVRAEQFVSRVRGVDGDDTGDRNDVEDFRFEERAPRERNRGARAGVVGVEIARRRRGRGGDARARQKSEKRERARGTRHGAFGALNNGD